jgi:hypothetical protein
VGGRARRSRHDVGRYQPSDAGNLESGLRWEVAEVSFQNHSANTEPVRSAAPRLLLSNVQLLNGSSVHYKPARRHVGPL